MIVARGSLSMLATAAALTLAAAAPVAAQSAGAGGNGGGAGATTGVPASPAPAIEAPQAEPHADAAPAATGLQPDAVQPATSQASAATPAAPVATADAEAQIRSRMLDACMVPPAKLPADQVQAFLANPTDLLVTYGTQSLTLSNRVRTLAGSDGRTLDPIFASIAQANDDQKAAIGAGLGRAAFMCQGVNPDYAADIQSRIADLDAPALLAAFLTATNDLQVAAIGGAGAAAGASAPGLSGGGLAGPGTAGLGGDDTVANLITPYTSSGGSGLVLGEDDDSSSNITINVFGGTSVSPTGAN